MQLSRSIGKPPRTLIQERILLESKRYLAFSSLSIADIGYKLGFEDANYFTRFFRLHEKKTPAQFRKQINADKDGSK
jgi:AraC family transcriptional activator of pobA